MHLEKTCRKCGLENPKEGDCVTMYAGKKFCECDMKKNYSGELIWKKEKDMQKELEETLKKRKEHEGKDGFIVSAEGKFTYRGISYLVKVLRYFNHMQKFTPMGSQRVTDSHAVVEYSDESESLSRMIPNDIYPDFLYHDTLHSWNDTQDIDKQIRVCHNLAKQDIDNLLDGDLIDGVKGKIIEQIAQLNETLEKLTEEIRKINEVESNGTR